MGRKSLPPSDSLTAAEGYKSLDFEQSRNLGLRSKSPNKKQIILWAIALQYISARIVRAERELTLAPNLRFIAENTDSTISLLW